MRTLFADYISTALARRAMDRRTFARLLVDQGVARASVSNWLNSRVSRPHPKNVTAIAEVLGVGEDEVVRASAASQVEVAAWEQALDRPVPRPSIRKLMRELMNLADEIARTDLPEHAEAQIRKRLAEIGRAVEEAKARP